MKRIDLILPLAVFGFLTIIYLLFVTSPEPRLNTSFSAWFGIAFMPLNVFIYIFLSFGLNTVDIYFGHIIYAILLSVVLFFGSKKIGLKATLIFVAGLYFVSYLAYFALGGGMRCPFLWTIMSFGKIISQIGCVH